MRVSPLILIVLAILGAALYLFIVSLAMAAAAGDLIPEDRRGNRLR
jgi:hypothetical protein